MTSQANIISVKHAHGRTFIGRFTFPLSLGLVHGSM